MHRLLVGAITVIAITISLNIPAHADTGEQDQQFLAALSAAGWKFKDPPGLVTQGRMVCVEGLAHGVSAEAIRSSLISQGYSPLDSATLITQAIATFCPNRRDAVAGVGKAASPAKPSSPAATGEWWDTPEQGQVTCNMVKVGGRDWTVNSGIGSYNGTPAGASIVDTLISKYCPQYAR